MKKAISIVAVVAGVLSLLSVAAVIIGIIFKTSTPSSVGIIGGADGPTTIMIAGTVGTGGIMTAIAIGVLLIGIGIWGLRKIKK